MQPSDAGVLDDILRDPLEPTAFDARDLNHAASPRTDLYAFVNATWCARTPVPDGCSCWDSFSILNERSLRLQARMAIECAGLGRPTTAEQRIVADFWTSGFAADDSATHGMQTLKSQLDRIEVVNDSQSIAAYLRHDLAHDGGQLFGLDVQPDFDDPATMMAFVAPQCLGLPDRDLYFDDTPRGKAILTAYGEYIARLLEWSGYTHAQAKQYADDVAGFERRLAQVMIPRRELARDICKGHHRVSVAEADRIGALFSWSTFFSTQGSSPATFSLANPDFHAEVDKLLRDAPPVTWRAYLRFHAIDKAAPYLSEDVASVHEQFHGGVLRGRTAPTQRWKRVLHALNLHAGEAMGALYADKYCRAADYKGLRLLVDELREAMRVRIAAVEWMGGSTKIAALKKLAGLGVEIGGPEKRRDWSRLRTCRDNWYANVNDARVFNRRKALAQIGQPVAAGYWSLTPQTVNARYDPQRNQILLPAAILQPPFFDPDADAALNYAGIGAVIAHEMLHGYDDQGSRFDVDGRFNNWWTQADRRGFDALTASLARHFSGQRGSLDASIDGRLTLGENIADLGGLALAFDALQRSPGAGDEPMLDGFSQRQRFFLNWAVLWRQNMTEDERRLRLRTDAHAPGQQRANVAAASLPAYALAFDCVADDPMLAEAAFRKRIW
jgi:putative endopeptidase